MNIPSKTGNDESDHESHGEQRDHQHHHRVGGGCLELVAQFGVRLVGLGDQGQGVAKKAAGLADPHQAHHQRGKSLGILAERGGEGKTGLDIGLYRGERGTQSDVLGLFDQHCECAHQRQTGIDQAGELPGEDRQRFEFDSPLAVGKELDLLIEPGLGDRRDVQRQ
ncbi:MAG: hypothetical protein QM804_19425 [Propionicimonas sp.]